MKILDEAYKRLALQEEQARERMLHKLADYYSGDQVRHLQPYFTDADIPVSFTPLTKYVIDKISLVYKKPAKRTIGDSSKGIDYKGKNQFYTDATLIKNALMKENERQVNLLGNTAILVNPMDDRTFDYKIIKYFIAHFDNDPINPIGISYPLDTSNPDTIWEHWFTDRHFLTDSEFNELDASVHQSYGIDTTENVYGGIPISFWHSTLNFTDFFSPDSEPVMNANEKVNMVLMDMNLYLRKQGFAWTYATGIMDDVQIEVGYDKITRLPDPQSKLDSVQFPERTNAFMDAIKGQLQILSKMYGIELELESQGVPSGFQLVVKKIDSLENWEDKKDIFRYYERKLYEVERMVSMSAWRYELPDYISINFADVELPIDKAEQRNQADWEVKNNLTTWAKYYAENIDSDLTPEEAQIVIEENAQANRTVTKVATGPTALEALLG